MGKILLNLNLDEPFSLLKKLFFFDNPIELDVSLLGSLNIRVYDPIQCIFLKVVTINLRRSRFLSHL
jgi:hypothetical protein